MGAAPEMHRRAQSRPIAALTLVRIFLARKPIIGCDFLDLYWDAAWIILPWPLAQVEIIFLTPVVFLPTA